MFLSRIKQRLENNSKTKATHVKTGVKYNRPREELDKNRAMLTFRAFFAASAPERLSKVTNPTGWKAKREETH